MSYKIYEHENNILKIALIGDIDEETVNTFNAEFLGIFEGYTESNPLSVLIDASQEGHISLHARRTITMLNKELRIHKFALVNAKQVNRVIATFILKATGRDNTDFFDDEESARKWLQKD